MKFTKIEKWVIYETWFYKDNKTKLVTYIRKMPKNYINNEFFHFQVSSANSKIFKGSYHSIDELKLYNTFDEVVIAVKNWWHENI